MKFAVYLNEGKECLGVLARDGAHLLPLAKLGAAPTTMLELIEAYSPPLAQRIEAGLEKALDGIPLETVTLAAPISQPRHDIICVGHNYLEHAKESLAFLGKEYEPLKYATYFGKRVRYALGHKSPIQGHADLTQMLDYEAELAVIIGKPASHVSREDAWNHIFGYTIINDVSARDLQKSYGGQFYFGKSLDGFTPMGPWVVTADELGRPPKLRVISRVNGEERQRGTTEDFIFDIPHLIADLSRGITLQPGDIIATGTPKGVGAGFDPPRFLKTGDVVECEVEGIGILENRVE